MNKLLLNTLKVTGVLCVTAAMLLWIANSNDLGAFAGMCTGIAFFLFVPIVVIAESISDDDRTEEKKNQLRGLRNQFFNAQMILVLIAIAAGLVADYMTTLITVSVIVGIIGAGMGMWKVITIAETKEKSSAK